MSVITIHAEDHVAEAVRAYAKDVGKSVNRAVNDLIGSSLGLMKRPRRKQDFSEFCGVLSKGDAAEIRANMKPCGRIERELWA